MRIAESSMAEDMTSARVLEPHLALRARQPHQMGSKAAERLNAERQHAWPASLRSLNDGLLDCANAPRNLQENYSDEEAQTWMEHRKIALSEMSLSVSPLLKTLLFEILPTWISGPLCTLIEGSQAATNRGMNPIARVTNPLQLLKKLILALCIFDTEGLTWYLIIFWSVNRDLPDSVAFEIFGVILLSMIAKAMVIAVKYAFKSDVLLVKGQVHDSLYSPAYQDTKQGERGQMGVYIMNLTKEDLQKDELINMLYKSSLIANTDLSCCCFSWNTPISIPGRATQAPPYEAVGALGKGRGEGRGVNPQYFGRNDGVAMQIWETMLEITKGVEEAKVFAQTDTDHNGAINLNEMLARARQALGDDFDEEAVRAQFNALDVDGNRVLDAQEMHARTTTISGKLMFSAKNGVLSTLLREDEATLRRRVLNGELPASVLALLIVVECSYITPKVGWKYFMSMVVCPSVFIAILPVLVRAVMGLPLFGTTYKEQIVCGLGVWLMFFTAFPVIMYFVGPCVWLYRQLLMCKLLLALIAVPKGPGVKWSPEAGHVNTEGGGGEGPDGSFMKTSSVGQMPHRSRSVVGAAVCCSVVQCVAVCCSMDH